MRQQAQIAPAMIIGLIVMLAIVAFGAIIFGEIHDASESQSESGRSNTTTQLLNNLFTDNTGTIVDDWDNSVDNAAVNSMDTSSGIVLTTVIDNGDVDGNGTGIWENGRWWQALTYASLQDGLVSATVTASCRLSDNENIEQLAAYVYLCDGTDNTTVWQTDTIVETTTWTSIDNNVVDNVDATGTYTLYLVAEIKPDNSTHGGSSIFQWTAANLEIITYTMGYGENIVGDVGEMGVDVFPLLLLTVLLAVFGAIILVLKVWG